MRHSLLVLTTASFGLFASLGYTQAAQDPSEAFLNAYMSAQQAEKLEREQRFGDALAKYRYAGTLLDQLHERHPQWQALIVEYRKKKTSESITRMEGKISLDNSSGEVVEGGGTKANANYTNTPVYTDGNDMPLPSEARSMPALGGGGDGGADVVDQAAREIRQQMAALRSQLEQARTQLDAVQGEKAKIAAQLHEALNKPAEGGSDEALKQELEEARAAATKSKTQLEHAQESEKELSAKLAQAQGQLENPEAADAAVRKQIEKLQSSLDDARADREVAEEQGELLSRKLAELAKRPDLSAKLADASVENDELVKQLNGAQKKIETLEEAERKLVVERDAQKEENTKLSTKLADAEKKTASQAAELAAAEQKLVTIVQERDTIVKERDSAIEQLGKVSKGKGELERLLAENGDLMKKLGEAQKTISTFEAGGEKSGELVELKEKLTSVQLQLDVAQADNQSSKSIIEGLQQQLTQLKDGKPLGNVPEEQQQLAQENELLRGIVMREMKDQARREQARKLIASELSRLQVRSEALNEQVEFLGSPTINLSESERALFKAPQMEIVDNDSNAIAISLSSPLFNEGKESAEAAGGGVGKANAGLNADTAVVPPGKADLPAELQPQADEARTAFENGKFKEAARLYGKLVSKAPTNIYALSNLGVAQFRSGNRKLAEATLRKVVAIAPDDSFSYATLGIIYFQQNKYDEAVNALTRSLALNPKNATAHNYLGVTAAQKGWGEAALKEIETAIQLDPTYADAHFNLAVVLATTPPPDKEKARIHYKKAVTLGAEADKALEILLK